MSEGNGRSPLDRTRRAKTEQKAEEDRRVLDGGAVAAGMLGTLGPPLVPAILLGEGLPGAVITLFEAGLPGAVVTATAALTALAVPLGGYVAGWFGGPGSRRGAMHGGAAVFASILAVGTAFAYLGSGGLLAAFGTGVALALVTLPTVAIGALVGGVAGYVGGKRRARAEREA